MNSTKLATEALRISPLSFKARIAKFVIDLAASTINDSDLDDHCRIFDRVSKTHWIAQLMRAVRAMRKENYKLALAELKTTPENSFIREISEIRSFAYFLRGTCHLELQEVAEAKRDILESVSCSENSPAFLLHGDLLFQEERYREAREAYRVAHRQNSSDAGILNAIGWCSVNLGDLEEGKSSFLAVLRCDPYNSDSLLGSIVAVAKKHVIHDSKLFCFPHIPEEQANNAVRSYAGHINLIEPGQIALLYDDTFWGSASDGLTIGSNGLTFKNGSEFPQRLAFSEIQYIEIESGFFGYKLKINGTRLINITLADDTGAVASAISKILLELAEVSKFLSKS